MTIPAVTFNGWASGVSGLNFINVKAPPYNAKGDGVTDDGPAFQSAVNALKAIGGGSIYAPSATYLIATGINWDTNIKLIGDGPKSSILKIGSSFTPASGASGNAVRAMICLENSGSSSTPTQGLVLEDASFDLTNQAGSFANPYYALYQSIHPMRVCAFNRLGFELGQYGIGIQLEYLGAQTVAGIPSYGLSFTNIYAHNGTGTVLLYANANGAGLSYRDVLIDGIINVVDQNVQDDRIGILGVNKGTGQSEIRDVIVRNVFVSVSSAATSGAVNGVKLDTGAGVLIHKVLVDGVMFSGNGVTGLSQRPFLAYVGSGSNTDDICVQNIQAQSTHGLYFQFRPSRTDVYYDFSKIAIMDCLDTTAALECYDAANPTTHERVTFSRCVFETSVTKGTLPVAIMLTGGSASAGAGGRTIIDGCSSAGYQSFLSTALAENGTALNTSWNGIQIRNCNSPDCTPSQWLNINTTPVNANVPNVTVQRCNPSYGGATPPALGASGAANYNTTGVDQAVSITGGTVSQIYLNGVATNLTSGMFTVQNGDFFQVSYTSAPTVAYSPLHGI